MALILVDVFSFPSLVGGGNEVYEIYLNNTGIGSISVIYTGTDGELFSVGETLRGRVLDSKIGDFNNEAVTGFYEVFADFDSPFAYTEGLQPLDPEPPLCDLTISATSTNETAQGADDGTVEVSATSSFTGVEVSIDNTNWFTSPHLFTGLVPANYTAYSRDSNSCSRTLDFAIEAFDNPISGGFDSGLPVVSVSAGNISKWNAAFNPIVINFQTTPDPLKKNFRIEIEVTSGSKVVIGTYSPNTLGATRADISAFLKTLVNANDDFEYDVLNWRDLNRAASYTLRYREVWDGDSSVWYNAPYPLYVTWSAKQLGDKWGGNMAEYVTFSNEPNPDLKAKFLTLFDEPTSWVGLPFDNSFILSEYVVDEAIKVRTTSLDINKQPISGGVDNLFLINNDSGYIIADTDSRLIIQQGALPPVANDGIFEQLGINRLMLAGNPSIGVEYFVIQLFTGDNDTPNFITQPLTIKVNQQCIDPYIYIKWLNTLGGWDYWRFGYDQVLSISTSNGIDIDRNVFDWENDETIAETISKNSVNRISFGAIVGLNKIKGLTGLHNSTKIQMLTNLNPYKWQTVTLAVGQFDIRRTKNKTAELRFNINLPQTNIQQQ